MSAPGETRPPMQRAPGLALAVVIVALACAAVYWPRLGATGFSLTEGHRVVPAWEMLERGDFLLPRMFGQIYLRKPPGMPWAVAGASAALGETELAARAVSAAAMTATALLALVFAARWYGARWALPAGLAMALTPLFWMPGRSAEIEALHNLGVFLGAAALLDVLVRKRPGRLAWAPVVAAALVAAALAKGPAGLPVLGGVVAGACLARRSVRPARSPVLWIGTVGATVVLGVVAWRMAAALQASGETAITQTPGEFMWSGAGVTALGLLAVAAMPVVAWASAFPASLALLFPWGPDARAEAPEGDEGWLMARATALAIVLSLGLYTVLGVHNPRYAMPAMTLAPMLAPYVVRGFRGAFVPVRRGIAGILLLGAPAAWGVLLLAGGAVYITVIEPARRASSGAEAGAALGAALPAGAEVWANDLIEARPEVLLYARRAAGRDLRVRWKPSLGASPSLPDPGGYVVLRTDAGSTELGAFQRAGLLDRLEESGAWTVHTYEFALYRVRD